ncbi:glutathione transferase [Ranunculus cassubicifolius]
MAAGGDDDVKILGVWSSPFAMRPRIALNLKNVSYKYLEEKSNDKSDLLLESNPVHKKVPVMIHNDKPISESLVILQYIDEAFTSSGPSILPSDPYERAIAHFWAAYLDDKWYKALLEVTTKHEVSFDVDEEEKKAVMDAVIEGLGLLEGTFQEISEGKDFFGGDTIGFLDIVLGSCLGWLRVSEELNECMFLDEEKTPGLYGWAARFCSHAAVKKVMPRTKKLAEHGFTLRLMRHEYLTWVDN